VSEEDSEEGIENKGDSSDSDFNDIYNEDSGEEDMNEKYNVKSKFRIYGI